MVDADGGNHGITALGRGCVKFWVLFPPTDHNLKVWEEHRQSKCVLNDAVAQLEGGMVVIQPTDMAMYIPPGCLHGTYTLRGGIVPGIVYTTEESLPITNRLIEIESRHFRKVQPEDLRPFLEAVIVSLESGSEKRDEALKALCQRSKVDGLKSQALFARVMEKVGPRTSCQVCGKGWRTHWK